MAPLDSQVCQVWPIDTANACWDVPATTPQTTIDFWQRAASQYLWARTGRRLGPSCPVTVRPCRKRCAEGFMDLLRWPGGVANSTGGWIPYIGPDGQFRNATLCGCAANCHCGPELCDVELPGPIHDITQVTVDGLVVDPISYRTVDGNKLRRVTDLSSGEPVNECWPSCQDLSRPETLPETFSVTYRTGLVLNGLATAAVTELTAHFIRGCSGCGDGCGGGGLRQNLASKSRQGVDLEFVDPAQVFGADRTGIEIVDWFIQSENPYGLASTLRVLSPDAGTRGRNLPEIWR